MMLGQLKDSHKSCSLPEAAVHVELAWKRILTSQEQTIDQALAFMALFALRVFISWTDNRRLQAPSTKAHRLGALVLLGPHSFEEVARPLADTHPASSSKCDWHVSKGHVKGHLSLSNSSGFIVPAEIGRPKQRGTSCRATTQCTGDHLDSC